MEVVSPEIQKSREMMLALEQEEFELGMRKRSHDYVCFRCGKMTHAKVGSERRKAYLCGKCWKHRCSRCGAKGVVGVNNVWFCKEHELIPTMQIIAPHMKPNETALDTIDRMKDERIKELQLARSIEDPDAWIQDRVTRTDWFKVTIKAWFEKGSTFWRMTVEKESKTFVWITFKGRVCKLRKTDLLGSAIGRWNVYLSRPEMEFKLELPVPTKE